MHGGRIHQHVLELQLRKFAADECLRDLAPQARGLEHVGLVDGGEAPAPPAGELRRHPHDALDLGDRVAAQVARARRVALLRAEVDAAGELAHEQQIDARHDVALEGRGIGKRGVHGDGTQVGERPQLLAQPQQTALRAQRRIGRRPLRAANGAEQHRIGCQTGGQGGRRQGIAVRLDGSAAEGQGGELEIVAEALRNRLKAGAAGSGHLRADAITRQHRHARLHGWRCS